MGITGLLPVLKKATKNSHIRQFSGMTVAIDAYSWLHKGAFGCAQKLGMGEPTDAYITYCMKYIQVLLDHKVKPIVVLDGRNLPSKEHTEKKRRQKREENRKLARKYMQEGNKGEAWSCFTKCVDITPAMAREFIKRLRAMKIDYVVAPYEADAEMAYLAINGIVDLIITEDSDLVLFGCPRIFFKMSVNGDGVLFEQSKLPQCFSLTTDQFNFDHFRWMCILSGCDYLASIPGIGLGRAKKVIYAANASYDNIEEMLATIPEVLEKVQVEVTDEYVAGFIQAENTFLYQLVFDTTTRTVVPLNKYPDNVKPSDMKYAGRYEDPELALGLALGNVDLHSLKFVDNFDPVKSGYPATSIWSPLFKKEFRTGITSNTTSKTAMQMSSITNKTKVSSKQSMKRPLADFAAANFNEDTPGDMELMNMYSESSTTIKMEEMHSSKTIKNDKTESPSAAKRRRLTQPDQAGEDTNTRSTRSKNRALPFLKSPENIKVHVKSKYFRTEPEPEEIEENLENSVHEINEDKDSKHDPDHQEREVSPSSSLSIYSHSTSQDSNFTDISASQFSSGSQSTKRCSGTGIMPSKVEKAEEEESESDTETDKVCSTTDFKTDEADLITLDDGDEDEGSMGVVTVTKSFASTLSTRTTRASFSQSSYATSPYFTDASYFAKSKSTSTRRLGLSRVVKKADPKQRSVKDMFARQAVKN